MSDFVEPTEDVQIAAGNFENVAELTLADLFLEAAEYVQIENIAEPNPEPAVIAEPNPEPAVIAEPNPEPAVIAEPNPEPAVIAEPNPEPAVIAEPNPEPAVGRKKRPLKNKSARKKAKAAAEAAAAEAAAAEAADAEAAAAAAAPPTKYCKICRDYDTFGDCSFCHLEFCSCILDAHFLVCEKEAKKKAKAVKRTKNEKEVFKIG